MSSKHPIDALFEKELKEHQSSPNEAVWEKIAANQQGTKPKREGIFFLRAASVLLLVGLSSFWYLNRHSGDIGIQPSNAPYQEQGVDRDEPGSAIREAGHEGEPTRHRSAQRPGNPRAGSPRTGHAQLLPGLSRRDRRAGH